MKFIVIGLGNFGASLSVKLTTQGHEVIGVDSDMRKVESVKDKITHAICLDCTDIVAISTLPLKDTDVAIVGIGEDFGASILTSALLKQNKVKRIISRALSPLHQTVLEAIGVSEIVHPEEESAERMAKMLEIKDILDSFDLFEDYKVVEAKLPEKYINKTVEEMDIRSRFNLNILTVVKMKEAKNMLGIYQKKARVVGYISGKTKFEQDDIILIFGKTSDIKNFLSSH